MQLTDVHKSAMRKVASGADVFDYGLAKSLREVEKIAPEMIRITGAMGDYGDGRNQEPYFGAILTKEGRRAIKSASAKREANKAA